MDRYRPDGPFLGYENVPSHRECAQCGQSLISPLASPTLCDQCQRQDREPQGQAMRLFTPAPNQMPGQLAM